MRSLRTLEFLARPAWPPAAVALFALAAALLAWQGWQTFDASSLLVAERAGLQGLGRGPARSAPTMSAQDRQRHAQIEALARYVASPWDQWLAAIEMHAGDRASLTQLEQDTETGTLLITARADSLEAMMHYVIALQNDPRLKDVQLQSHDMVSGDKGAPVQFRVTAMARALAAPPPASASAASGAGAS